MTDQPTFDFYASNDGASYPFAGISDVLTKAFVDAVVTIPRGLTGDVMLTQWDPTGAFEIKVGADVVIPMGAPVSKQSFGAYWIWEARVPGAQATLVFVKDAVIPAVPSGQYIFADRAVVLGSSREIFVTLGAQEILGPGGTLAISGGANASVAAAAPLNGNTDVLISASFDPTEDCSKAVIVKSVVLSTVNGLRPDGAGNFSVIGASTFVVDKLPGIPKLNVTNVGVPCCECPDYVRLYGAMGTVTDRMQAVSDEFLKIQDLYRQLLSYARFSLQTSIVGSVNPNDTDRIVSPS